LGVVWILGFVIWNFSPVFISAGTTGIQTPEDKILAKGFAAYMDGANKQALNYFEEVARINPQNKAARIGLQKVKIRLRKAEDLEKARALALTRSRYKEGRALQKTGDIVAAIDSFHAALDSTPKYKPALAQMKAIKNDMQRIVDKKTLNLTTWAFARGVMAYLDRDWSKAWRIWSERSRLEPTNIALANATIRAENNFKTMMISEKEDFFRRGARAFYEQGLYKESQASWQRVQVMRPDDEEALQGVMRAEEAILRQEGKSRSAESHDILEKALEYYAEQNWKKALEAFEQLHALDPNFTSAQQYIDKVKGKLNTSVYSGASDGGSFRQTRSSNEGNEAVAVPSKLENFDVSKKELESKLKRDPTDINMQRELDKVTKTQDEESERIYKEGLIAYSQGNRALPIQQWKHVLVINPDHTKAAAALKKARAEEDRSADPSSGAPQ
jgi:tetratricopeptide (TPR) repeat protein